MKFHEQIAEYLPSLRRYSHAVTGSASVGDAQVATLIETLIRARPSALGDLPLNLALYRMLTLSAATFIDTAPAPQLGKFRRCVQTLALRQRQALLLTSVEGLTLSDVGCVMDCTEDDVRALISAATQSMNQAKSDAEILIVGEHQPAADALRRMLDNFGYAISDVAHSLQDALAIAAERRPGVVVADLRGQHAIQRLAAFAKSLEAPLVYISSTPLKTLADDLDNVLHVGKPIEARDIKATIDRALFGEKPDSASRSSAA
ncbi:MAG: hypothetical protein HOJ21_07395 [Alphaproteobacteria bacterium]|jgi:CheY-like chemotaxis protein|nr:hypothetical protein [Alphaproteobacteria bacterium]